MKLLVLGGTVFLGRHVVEAALEEGHEVATFTRGRANPGLHPEAEALIGDRDGALDAPSWAGGTAWWTPPVRAADREAVVRSCCAPPPGATCSSRRSSTYADQRLYDESAALATVDDPLTEDVGCVRRAGQGRL
jgi:2'-hydroxyisoflavone reductase